MTDLLTPDKNAILSFIYGLICGALGTLIRNSAVSKTDTRREGTIRYFCWSAFGAIVALGINSVPIVSIIIGLFAPIIFEGLQKFTPSIIELIKSRLLPGSTSTNTNTKKD